MNLPQQDTDYDVELGETIQSNNNNNTNNNNNKQYQSLVYQFKPKRIKESQWDGEIKIDYQSGSVLLQIKEDGFKGKYEEKHYKQQSHECILLFDPNTNTFRLEKLFAGIGGIALITKENEKKRLLGASSSSFNNNTNNTTLQQQRGIAMIGASGSGNTLSAGLHSLDIGGDLDNNKLKKRKTNTLDENENTTTTIGSMTSSSLITSLPTASTLNNNIQSSGNNTSLIDNVNNNKPKGMNDPNSSILDSDESDSGEDSDSDSDEDSSDSDTSSEEDTSSDESE
ncbi:hypothetical protein ABK040_000283 [Willaertia magna]